MKRLCAILLVICFFMSDARVVLAAETSYAEKQESESFETDNENETVQEGDTSDSGNHSVENEENDDIDEKTGDSPSSVTDDTDSTNTNTVSEQTKQEETGPEESENFESEEADPQLENSWRYLNGELITSKVRSRANFNAWEKVNGVYVNDRGEAIENAIYKGIDVSHHQERIDWEKVKADGIDFAIIRCGYGADDPAQDDKWWEYNVSECERLGIPYGV